MERRESHWVIILLTNRFMNLEGGRGGKSVSPATLPGGIGLCWWSYVVYVAKKEKGKAEEGRRKKDGKECAPFRVDEKEGKGKGIPSQQRGEETSKWRVIEEKRRGRERRKGDVQLSLSLLWHFHSRFIVPDLHLFFSHFLYPLSIFCNFLFAHSFSVYIVNIYPLLALFISSFLLNNLYLPSFNS